MIKDHDNSRLAVDGIRGYVRTADSDMRVLMETERVALSDMHQSKGRVSCLCASTEFKNLSN